MILFMGGGGELKTRIISVLNFDSLPDEEWQETIALISGYDLGEIYVMNNPPDSPNVGDVHIRPNLSSQLFYTIGNVTVPYADIYQFSGSDWRKVEYYQFIGTEWKTARVYLLDGLEETGFSWSTASRGYTCAVTEIIDPPGGYRITGYNSTHNIAALQTASKIDLTGFSKLFFKGRNTGPSIEEYEVHYPARGGIQDRAAINGEEGTNNIRDGGIYSESEKKLGEFTLECDISNYEGLYYVGIASGFEDTEVYQIWLEV